MGKAGRLTLSQVSPIPVAGGLIPIELAGT